MNKWNKPYFKPCRVPVLPVFSKETSCFGFCDDRFIKTFASQVTQLCSYDKAKRGILWLRGGQEGSTPRTPFLKDCWL